MEEVGILPSEDLKKHAEDVISILGKDTKTPVNVDDIQGQLERFLEYGVPLDQAKQTLLKKYSSSTGSYTPVASERTKLSDLESDMRSVKILAQIVSINPKEISVKGEPRQIFYGILRDESGSVSFTSWHDIAVSKGDVVEIGNAYTSEWQGAVQINIGNRTQVEKKTDDALPKEAYEPKKCMIQDLYPGFGAVDLKVFVLEVGEKEVEVDGEKKTVISGVFGDSSGKCPFTSWHDFDLKVHDTISLVGGYVRSWKGIPQITFDEKAKVKKVKKDALKVDDISSKTLRLFEVEEHAGLYDVSLEGTVIEIQQGSGFILRCPECNRMIRDGQCSVHGAVEGVSDFRIKCIVDDGSGAVNAIFNKDLSEKLLGKTVDECKKMDPESFHDMMKESLFAHVIKIKGNTLRDRFGTTCIPSDVEHVIVDVQKEAEAFNVLLEGDV